MAYKTSQGKAVKKSVKSSGAKKSVRGGGMRMNSKVKRK